MIMSASSRMQRLPQERAAGSKDDHDRRQEGGREMTGHDATGHRLRGHELLTNEEMGRADRLAVEAGVPSLTLMENAGRAVAREAMAMAPAGARVAVLCGPGNNGGDGFVAARLLGDAGYQVRLALLGSAVALRGDAAIMAGRWRPATEPWHAVPAILDWADLVIDAMFGAGLARPLDGPAAVAVDALSRCGAPVLAVDVPSGLDGSSGGATGPLVRATRTVTFCRLKPGHLLMPGRELCGQTVLADIGIPTSVLSAIGPLTSANVPDLWRGVLPRTRPESHKYTRGHVVVVSGAAHRTGAARLGARGALRAGAGLVTVASPPDAVTVNAAHLTAIMLEPFDGPRGLAEVLDDQRRNAILIGPGAGVGIATRLLVQVALEYDAAVTLDADALTSFTIDQDDDEEPVVRQLFELIREKPQRPVVLTPHEGEFKRTFGALPELADCRSKLERARAAAKVSGAVVVLKGPDTVIAGPDGRAAINDNAPPWLATAGSGDVLAGLVSGLLAQGMPAFEAACAAAWMHGACAAALGPGLIAEDLPEAMAGVWTGLLAGC
jgi:hydroxyethylthiazole kinase-like uncharacterized protein yjeF